MKISNESETDKKKWLDIKRNHKIRNESIFLKIEIKKRNNKTIK